MLMGKVNYLVLPLLYRAGELAQSRQSPLSTRLKRSSLGPQSLIEPVQGQIFVNLMRTKSTMMVPMQGSREESLPERLVDRTSYFAFLCSD